MTSFTPPTTSPTPAHLTPRLLPANASDIPTLARIQVLATTPDLLLRLIYPNLTVHQKAIEEALAQEFKSRYFKILVMKAVNDDGEIMGWGIWFLRSKDLGSQSGPLWIGAPDPELKDAKLEEVEFEKQVDFPAKRGLAEYLHDHGKRILDNWLLGKKHILLNGLFTLPKFQRRGVGTALLRWGHELADKECVPSFLQGTPFGYPLYKELGWKKVDVLSVDLSSWAIGPNENGFGWGVYRINYMIRQPEAED